MPLTRHPPLGHSRAMQKLRVNAMKPKLFSDIGGKGFLRTAR